MSTFKPLVSFLIATFFLSSCHTTPSQNGDKAVKEIMKEFSAVGISAAVVKDGKIIYNESFGYKDLDRQIPLSNTDIMRIASISKSFTAVSLMQLVEKGTISLDDDISDLIGFTIRNPYFPEDTITLRMVLSHTSSIKDKEDYFTLDHLNPAVYGDCEESYHSEYRPGQGYDYSNMGLNLAGSILEKVSGVRFDEYVRDSVIRRLGLYGGHNIDSLDANRFAKLYSYDGMKFIESRGAYRSRSEDMPNYVMGYSTPLFSPTGGVKISAADLARYMMMHMNYGTYNGVQVISEESAHQMQTVIWQETSPNEETYCLCLRHFTNNYLGDSKYDIEGNYPIGHTGSAYGLRSIMIFSRRDNWGIVAMTNGYAPVEGKDFIQSLATALYNALIK